MAKNGEFKDLIHSNAYIGFSQLFEETQVSLLNKERRSVPFRPRPAEEGQREGAMKGVKTSRLKSACIAGLANRDRSLPSRVEASARSFLLQQ